MKNGPDTETLLRDILDEDAPSSARGALLDQVLQLARRRRRMRQVRAGAVCAALVMLALLIARSFVPSPTISVPKDQPAPFCPIVATQPLRQRELVHTRSFAASIVTSTPVPEFTTAASGYRPHEIDDDELLQLAAPNAVILVRNSRHQAQLLFPEGENGRRTQ